MKPIQMEWLNCKLFCEVKKLEGRALQLWQGKDLSLNLPGSAQDNG
jgi:hypothetical protein